MRRRLPFPALASVVIAGLALGACDTGSVGGGTPDGGDLPAEALCEATITTAGTFATSVVPAPVETDGCVPEGTWTIQTTLADMGDCAAVEVEAQYVVLVTGTGRDRMITLQDPPAGAEVVSNVHAGGNGECEMTLEIISAAPTAGEFDVLQLKPYNEPGTTPILGGGTYQLWSKHP